MKYEERVSYVLLLYNFKKQAIKPLGEASLMRKQRFSQHRVCHSGLLHGKWDLDNPC